MAFIPGLGKLQARQSGASSIPFRAALDTIFRPCLATAAYMAAFISLGHAQSAISGAFAAAAAVRVAITLPVLLGAHCCSL